MNLPNTCCARLECVVIEDRSVLDMIAGNDALQSESTVRVAFDCHSNSAFFLIRLTYLPPYVNVSHIHFTFDACAKLSSHLVLECFNLQKFASGSEFRHIWFCRLYRRLLPRAPCPGPLAPGPLPRTPCSGAPCPGALWLRLVPLSCPPRRDFYIRLPFPRGQTACIAVKTPPPSCPTAPRNRNHPCRKFPAGVMR